MGAHHSKQHHSISQTSARQAPDARRASQGNVEPILQEGTRIDLLGASNIESSVEEDIMKEAEPAILLSDAERTAPDASRISTISDIERACEPRSTDDAKLAGLFPPDRYATYEMGCIDDFVGGLGAMVGPPNPDLMTTMIDEHTMRYDSTCEFSHAPYWIRTTSRIEWFFVTDPEGGLAKLGLPEWPAEGEDAVEKCTVSSQSHPLRPCDRRKPQPLSAFQHKLDRHNRVLQKYNLPAIMHEELIGGRLYSGPLAVKYQAFLQAVDSRDPAKHRRYIELCSDRKTMEAYLTAAADDPMAAWEDARGSCTNYSTTLHVIKSILLRLGKLMTACKLYRGLNGMAPPPSFLAERFLVRGGIEPGFLTTSRDRQKAVNWAQSVQSQTTTDGSQEYGLLFEIDQGLVDRGADISWFAQYPKQDEIIFPPNTALQVTAVRDEGKHRDREAGHSCRSHRSCRSRTVAEPLSVAIPARTASANSANPAPRRALPPAPFQDRRRRLITFARARPRRSVPGPAPPRPHCSVTGNAGGGAKCGASPSTPASTSPSAPTPTKTVTTPVPTTEEVTTSVPTTEEGSAVFDESAFSRFVLEFIGNDWLLPAPALARDRGGDDARSGGLGDDAHSGGSCSCSCSGGSCSGSGGSCSCNGGAGYGVAAGADVGSYVELLDSYPKPALSQPFPMGTETGIETVGGGECPEEVRRTDDQYKDPEYERKKAAFTHRCTYRIRYQAQGERALSKEHARERQLELRLALASSTLPLLLT
jgi:hypothetical protein